MTYIKLKAGEMIGYLDWLEIHVPRVNKNGIDALMAPESLVRVC